MIDWVNIALRTLMCLAFLVLVLRPMMMVLVRREPDQEALEELAKSAVGSAFKAWGQNADAPAYYLNPELALLVANNPDLTNIPEPSQAAEKVPDDAIGAVAATTPGETATVDAGASPTADERPGTAGTAVATTASGSATDVAGSAQSPEVEEEVDTEEQLQQMRDRIKQEQKKAKPTIPAELLNNANSYEDKLMVVRMIVDQERDRVAATLKRMVKVE